ncbi:MAG: hypothetical protein QOG87_4137 [Actinomycetota bacterium]|jgi:uncharacterized protein YhaN
MIRTPVRLAALALTAGLSLAMAAPAGAQTTTTAPPARLDQLKAKSDEQIKERTEQIRKLDSAVAGARADCGHNADLRSQLAADKTGLEALNADIQAETVPAEAVALHEQIFTHFRIYWLETPKTRVVLGCDRVTVGAGTLAELEAKIQARADEAKAAGKDVAAAQAALDTMITEIASATTAANQADDAVIVLKADKGDRAVLDANKAALTAARQKLRAAMADLEDARTAARTAVDALKSA